MGARGGITSVIQERDGGGLDLGGMLKKFKQNAQIVVIFWKKSKEDFLMDWLGSQREDDGTRMSGLNKKLGITPFHCAAEHARVKI